MQQVVDGRVIVGKAPLEPSLHTGSGIEALGLGFYENESFY